MEFTESLTDKGDDIIFMLELCTQFLKIQFLSPFFTQNRC